MECKETAPQVVPVSRVTLGLVGTLVSRVAKEPLDPKEMMESPEIQALITPN